jgi:Family of unknown function (DUF5362)
MAYPNPNPIQSVPASQDNQLVQQLSLPLFQARGWLKFLGVLEIIAGVLYALTIVGLLFAWLPIWMGVLMYQAGSSIEAAGQFGDKFAFLRSMGNLKTYFVIQGVVVVVSFALVVISIIVMLVFGIGLANYVQ